MTLRPLALVSGVYDLMIAAPMLLAPEALARLFGAAPPVPVLNAQLNGVFALALAAGYFWAAGGAEARRGDLWAAGGLAPGLGGGGVVGGVKPPPPRPRRRTAGGAGAPRVRAARSRWRARTTSVRDGRV